MSKIEFNTIKIGSKLKYKGNMHTVLSFRKPLNSLSQVIITCDFNEKGWCPVSFKQIQEEFEIVK